MIHLSNDLSEKSNLHFDQHDNNDLFTCWLSIFSNYYNPISILKLVIKNLRIFYQEYLFQIFLRHINPEIGNLNLWDGHNLHKRNLNISENISCAYQMKFSKKKYIFDSQMKRLNPNLNITSNSNDYLKNFQQFNDLVLSLDKIKYKDIDYENIFGSTSEILSKQFRKKNEKISFSLSILAQRLMVHGKKFNIHDYKKGVGIRYMFNFIGI